MPSINEIDKNFSIKHPKGDDDTVFYDVDSEPFKVYGLMCENGAYCRMSPDVARATNEGVDFLNFHTAGGRVRFITNSKKICIKSVMHRVSRMSHFSLTGCAAFDMYIRNGDRECYKSTFIPPYDVDDGYESTVELGESNNRLVTLNFPLYSGVKKLFIGLDKGAVILPPPEYTVKKPVVYYGSSITQGGCASRAGTAYEAIISRELDCDYINLGFSGSARGEVEMAEYISNLDMSAFVFDYDHNAPTAEHLRETHKRMFDIIRGENPDLPIIMLSRPLAEYQNDEKDRESIVFETYFAAKNSGDSNVYFISGKELICDDAKETFSVDGTHPNDCGFVSMAKVISNVLKTVIK